MCIKTRNSRMAGFTLVEIMIVVAIIGLLAAIAIPNFIQARETSQKDACINNLRQIDAAKQQWALENGKLSTDTPSPTSLAPYLGHSTGGQEVNVNGGQVPNKVNCPAGGTYTIKTVGEAPICSLSATAGHKLP